MKLKNVIVGSVVTMILAISSVLAYAQQSVAGQWMMSVQGMSFRLVLVQDGERISGTLESPHGAISLTGNFSKGKLTISGASAEPHVVQVAGTANVAADGSLAGSISVEQMEMNFTAVRAQGK